MDYGKKERIGGFNLLKFKRDDMTFIKVSTIMGNWAMEYREDTALFHFLDEERTKEQNDALQVIIVNAFMAASFAESDYQHELLMAASGLQERMNRSVEPVSDEEDKEILENMKAEAEVVEELEKGQNEQSEQ